jgi:hypothetical protein
MVLPESGLVYEVTKGVLTGHSFTSIITTLCAYLTLSTSIHKACTYDELIKTKLQGAGDDWIMKLPKEKLTSINEFVTLSGNPCDDFIENEGRIKSTYPDKFCTFLKKHYLFGLIAWNENELFTNWVYPTSTKMKLHNKIMDRLIMCVSGPFNSNINYCAKKLIIYDIIDFYTRGRHGWYKDVYYNRVFDQVYARLLSSDSIDEILLAIPNSMEFEWYGQISGSTCSVPIREITEDYMTMFDTRVSKSRLWMLRPTFFERHESVRRLKVFDVNKKYIAPYFTDLGDTWFSRLYKACRSPFAWMC